ncbi:carbon monoxide dehydrogenase subunit G [Streptomyces sp. A7024]|uniref:Carbon monoxide dehydrogenase subunit G n=1 Tax=Streptomyces coryli TaxID=1128680 RepID=A0A6G4U4C9_9ACTN|nr:carbon monoxide dehydrogenase subunit G [Streptomyces coryli]
MYVPFPAATVRRALADPDRVARAIPGLQLDAGDEPREEGGAALQGRLRLRIAGSTITYRGTLRVTPQGETFAIEGEGSEARGTGSVKLALTITPRPADGGTALACSGTVSGEGRISAVPPAQAKASAGRLLERFAESLTAGLETTPIEAPDDDNDRAIPGIPGPEARHASDEKPAEPAPDDADQPGSSVFEAEIPPPSLDPLAEAGEEDEPDTEAAEDVDLGADAEAAAIEAEAEELAASLGPQAEAAHARRSMIGRSTEEVDHAPPRGRYAPMPPTETLSPVARLRWAAPAAAVAVATVVVIGRALRRRR